MKTIALVLGLLLVSSMAFAEVVPGHVYQNDAAYGLNTTVGGYTAGTVKLSFSFDLTNASTCAGSDWGPDVPGYYSVWSGSTTNDAVAFTYAITGWGSGDSRYVAFLENPALGGDKLLQYRWFYNTATSAWEDSGANNITVATNGRLTAGSAYNVDVFVNIVDGTNDFAYAMINGDYQYDAAGRRVGMNCSTTNLIDTIYTGWNSWGFIGAYGFGTTVQGDITVGAVPEPCSILALGSGLVGMIGFGIRRRR